MAVRALAIDLDGTLLGPDGQVSARNRRAVRAAVDAGLHVVLATARWFQLAERTAAELGLHDPVIACSGAEVRRLSDGTDLMDVRLPPAFTDELYRLCDETGAIVSVAEEERVLFRMDGDPPALGEELVRVSALSGAASGTPRMVMVYGPETNARIIDELAPRWQRQVRFPMSVIGNHGATVLTLTGHGADKGVALEIACADLGVDVADTVAFGDSETDLEMFRVAGASVAMGQADDEVRAAATEVTAANADDGVAIAIEDLLSGG